MILPSLAGEGVRPAAAQDFGRRGNRQEAISEDFAYFVGLSLCYNPDNEDPGC
jgi:hypothetical protein